MEVADGATTLEVAERIGPRLAQAAIAGRVVVNGQSEIVDVNRPLPDGCTLHILTQNDESEESLYVLRHSTAHVMAEAICKLFPETKLVYGPPVEGGFYYDIDLERSITPDDFEKIEAEMAGIIAQDRPFTRYELPRQEAMAKLHSENSRYKIDNATRAEGDSLSFYVTGEHIGQDFEDLCRGPHVPRTGLIGAFKMRQVSGSHYRGDVNDKALQRVYGTAFFKKKALKQYLEQMEEARKRDHRVLGKELGLFSISQDVGQGMILWHPKGAKVRMLLERFLMAEMLQRGYEPVMTPHIGRLELYRTSGHYPYYSDSQFPPLYETDRARVLLSIKNTAVRAAGLTGEEHAKAVNAVHSLIASFRQTWTDVEGLTETASLDAVVEAADRELVSEEGYMLKPMNCPHHIQIYKAVPRSYRELPVRFCEFGTVYRYEQSGELNGMIRVRGFTQDDAHLFCTPEQIENELAATVELTQMVLDTLEFKNYRVRLGLRDPDSSKYIGGAELWDQAEGVLRTIAQRMELDCSEEPGEAAFYGPKIDFLVRDCIGREWQLGTVQVDYIQPENFDLTYVGRDNRPHRPIMIHRAPFGSMERFIGILIEHFAGAFPLWLAPVQVVVATVSEKSEEYGRKVFQQLAEFGLRIEIDDSSDKIGPKKHRLRARKVPYILVVGEQEAADNTVNVNDRDGRTLGTFSVVNFMEWCRIEIESKGKKEVSHNT
jgi:threonyl-tRNA synthetase